MPRVYYVLLVSVVIKRLRKFAAKQFKPNGFLVIPPWQAKKRLKNVPVIELCGIGEGITKFLAKYGAHTCGDVGQLPISIFRKTFRQYRTSVFGICVKVPILIPFTFTSS